jgi:hypothetical protein
MRIDMGVATSAFTAHALVAAVGRCVPLGSANIEVWVPEHMLSGAMPVIAALYADAVVKSIETGHSCWFVRCVTEDDDVLVVNPGV